MKEFILDKGTVYYDEIVDGGGTTFGVNAVKDERVKSVIKPGNILEMCSGPGFIGFYLYFEGIAKKLYLSDIVIGQKVYIDKTIKEGQLTNVEFIHSNAFRYFDKDLKFDTIVMNPPHFSSPRKVGYDNQQNEIISLDEDMKFHKEFLDNAKNFLNDNGVIIIIGNMGGITAEEIMEYCHNDYTGEIVAIDRFGWIRDRKFYVLKLKMNVH